jgi:hypothetical protein
MARRSNLILPGSSSWPGFPARAGDEHAFANERRVDRRPVVVGPPSRLIHFDEFTYVDEADPGTNFSTADPVYAGYDQASNTFRQIIIKFPEPITAVGPLYLICEQYEFCGIVLWDGTIGANVVSWVPIYPITNFNARTIADLTWANKGDLTLGAAFPGTVIGAKVDTSYLGQDLFSGNAGNDANANYLGATIARQTLVGLLLDFGMSWGSAFYFGGGTIQGYHYIPRIGETGERWQRAVMYTPA